MKPTRLIACTTTLSTGLVTALPALADTGEANWSHHGMMWGSGAGWFMGPIMMLLFLALIVGVVVLAIRWSGGDIGGQPRRGGSSAKGILEERFARGEIDEEEFRKRKQALDE